MATDRLINSTQGDSIITKLDDIKTAINNQSAAATEAPLMDGTATVGTSTKYARENHVHPTDTSRAANVMSTYAVDTTRENITTSSTVQGAIEQLEYREELNKNNISYIANNNVINIFSRAAGTYTHNGVTFTTNIDGSINLSGTAAGGAAVLVFSSSLDTTDDTYILYGDGFIEGVYMDTYETGWANQRMFTTWVETVPNTKIWRLIVSNGTNANNVTIRPMMCKKSLFDGIYHQPALNNAELTAKEQTNENNISTLQNMYATETIQVNLNDLTWTASAGGQGVYYSNIISLTTISTVLSAILIDFGTIKSTDNIWFVQTASSGNGFRLLCNDTTFLSDTSYVTYRIFGLKQ